MMIKRQGFLPEYGHIYLIPFFSEKNGAMGIQLLDDDFIHWATVSKKEINCVSNALKSQVGELTMTDFYPKRVEEILNKALKGGGYSATRRTSKEKG